MKLGEHTAEYIRAAVDKYKYALLPGLVGLLLLLWPSDQGDAPVKEPEELTLQVEVTELERRICDALGQIQGVGRVKVILTLRTGYETVYLFNEDRTVTENQSGYSDSRKSVLVQRGAGTGAEPIVTKVRYPVFQGALVVCQGAENPAVQLRVTEAVRALTGLAANNIVISKMKS